MLPLVFPTPLDSSKLFTLDLSRLLDLLWHVSVALDSSDLGHVRIPRFERLVILKCLAVARRFDVISMRGVGAPEPDISIVRAGQDVFRVRSELRGEDP